MRQFSILRRLVVSAAAAALLAAAQASSVMAQRPAAPQAGVEQKREWLRRQLTSQLRTAQQVRETNARIDRMNGEQIDRLVALYQRGKNNVNQRVGQEQVARDRLARERAALQRELAYREYLRRQLYYQQLYGGRGPVAYQPVITWLPSGTSLNAGGVISPDGRYVRVNAQPFFSSVGPVRTFNMVTGESRLTYPGDANFNSRSSFRSPINGRGALDTRRLQIGYPRGPRP